MYRPKSYISAKIKELRNRLAHFVKLRKGSTEVAITFIHRDERVPNSPMRVELAKAGIIITIWHYAGHSLVQNGALR